MLASDAGVCVVNVVAVGPTVVGVEPAMDDGSALECVEWGQGGLQWLEIGDGHSRRGPL
jgi:hypothetical protein